LGREEEPMAAKGGRIGTGPAAGSVSSACTPGLGSCDAEGLLTQPAGIGGEPDTGADPESAPTPATTFAIHYDFQRALADHVHGLQVKDKRAIFATMRKAPKVQPDSFLPTFGMTVGEFATFNILAPGVRKPSGSRRAGTMGTGTGTGPAAASGTAMSTTMSVGSVASACPMAATTSLSTVAAAMSLLSTGQHSP